MGVEPSKGTFGLGKTERSGEQFKMTPRLGLGQLCPYFFPLSKQQSLGRGRVEKNQ